MKNHKKRVFKEGDVVHCVACRCVVSCGYEHTFETCLKELAVEAGMSSRDIELSGKRLKEDLFNHNPKFKESRENLRDAIYKVQNVTDMVEHVFSIGELKVYDGGDAYGIVVKKIVSDMAHSRLRRYIKEGNERKLFFQELMPTVGRRFPRLIVKKRRVVVTGIYYPSEVYGTYEERDIIPAGLNNAKHHVLLDIDAYNWENRADLPPAKFRDYPDSTLSLLADDCVHDDDLKMTDKLMEAPRGQAVG